MRRVLFLVAVSVVVSLAATTIAFLVTHPDRLPAGLKPRDEPADAADGAGA